jgi:hypothetical protein
MSDHSTELQLTKNGTRRVYAALCAVARMSGGVSTRQRDELCDYQDFLGIDDDLAEDLEDGASATELKVGKRADEQTFLMSAMIDMAVADGFLGGHEEKLLVAIGRRMGLDRAQLGLRVERALASRAVDFQSADPDLLAPPTRGVNNHATVDVASPFLDPWDSDSDPLLDPSEQDLFPVPARPTTYDQYSSLEEEPDLFDSGTMDGLEVLPDESRRAAPAFDVRESQLEMDSFFVSDDAQSPIELGASGIDEIDDRLLDSSQGFLEALGAAAQERGGSGSWAFEPSQPAQVTLPFEESALDQSSLILPSHVSSPLSRADDDDGLFAESGESFLDTAILEMVRGGPRAA